MARRHKILFLRKFKKMSGGQIKVRDYFLHCLRHPGLDPYIYFSPDSLYQHHELWAEIPAEKIVREIQLNMYDMIFIVGRDWDFLPPALEGKKVINLIQGVRHGDKNDVRFSYLHRPAFRICVSEGVLEAISPHINGEAVVITYGIPLELFDAPVEKAPRSIFIWAKKNPHLGGRLHHQLREQGLAVTLLVDLLPRAEFARKLGESDIFIALPLPSEGFFLPALEGMAARCAVICSDAVGNREFCRHGETCMMPKYDDYETHLNMVDQLLADSASREKIRQQGFEVSQAYRMETERENFYRFLEKFIL